MTSPPPRLLPAHRPPRGRTDWAKVEGFTRTAMRVGAGDDVGSLTTPAKKRRFVLDGHSLRLAALLILVLALSGAIGALSQLSDEVAAIPPSLEQAAADGESAEDPEPSAKPEPPKKSAEPVPAEQTPAQTQPATIVVHVSGEVAAPGVVTMPAPARVNDAIMAAGGPTAGADLARINLAQPIEDGVHIHVPSPDDVLDPPLAGPGAVVGGAPSDPAGGVGADGKVNINTADQAALETIPGVGPVTARAIIAWRTENGAFTSVDQLIDVTGIGPKTLEQLRDHVRV